MEAPARGSDQALSEALAASCDKEIVLLGERSNHGDGETEAFKSSLVSRLIDECGFDTILFEASSYEFRELNRRLAAGETLQEEDLGAAIGALWNRDREIQPLISFLVEKANAGSIRLGGLDGQIGGVGQHYSNDEFGVRLFSHLLAQQRQICTALLRQRIYYDFPPDQSYTPTDQMTLLRCIDDAAAALTPSDRTWLARQAASVRRWIASDFLNEAAQVEARERWMYEDFKSYYAGTG